MTITLHRKILVSSSVAVLLLLGLIICQSLAGKASQALALVSDSASNSAQISQQQLPKTAQQEPLGNQCCRGSDGGNHRNHYNRMYNLNTIETISGEVVSMDKFTPMGGMSQGVHLILETDQETISVHLGPRWYIENQDIGIEPKDIIEVKGSRVNFAEQPGIIAAQVKKGEATLILRDDNGVPAWSGWRRHQVN